MQDPSKGVSVLCQTDLCCTERETALNEEVQLLRGEVVGLRSALQAFKFGATCSEGDNHKTHFYTGLSTFFLFQTLLSFLSQQVKKSQKLFLADELFIVLVKLCLNARNIDLAYRSGVSISTIIWIFHKWIHVMYVRLKALIVWRNSAENFASSVQTTLLFHSVCH